MGISGKLIVFGTASSANRSNVIDARVFERGVFYGLYFEEIDLKFKLQRVPFYLK